MQHIGKQKLDIYLMEHGITQNQLARYIGVSTSHLSDMRTGRRSFLVKHKQRIANVLNRTIDQIIWDK